MAFKSVQWANVLFRHKIRGDKGGGLHWKLFPYLFRDHSKYHECFTNTSIIFRLYIPCIWLVCSFFTFREKRKEKKNIEKKKKKEGNNVLQLSLICMKDKYFVMHASSWLYKIWWWNLIFCTNHFFTDVLKIYILYTLT